MFDITSVSSTELHTGASATEPSGNRHAASPPSTSVQFWPAESVQITPAAYMRPPPRIAIGHVPPEISKRLTGEPGLQMMTVSTV